MACRCPVKPPELGDYLKRTNSGFVEFDEFPKTLIYRQTSTLYQTVTVPSGGASLNFWLNITTSEAAGAAVFDRCFIEVRSTSGTLLATLATFSNQNSGTAGVYVSRGPYNLGAFAGQTVRIQFRATEDITLPTSFRVDDVTVQ